MEPFGRPSTSVLGSISKLAPIACAIVLIAVLQTGSPARAQSIATLTTFANSVKEPAKVMASTASVAKNVPSVVRSELTDAETQAIIDFSIALKMRNFAELQDRIGMGEIISENEMREKYFPASGDVENVRRWLVAQGFEVQPSVQYELSVFARGSVAQLQRSFGIKFARVQFHGEEHTSAVTAPSLPVDVAEPVLSINGLQPHLHPFAHSIRKAAGVVKSISNQAPYLVSEIAGAYDASSDDGSGQKIGIVIDTFPLNSDLTTFWNDNGVSQSLGNIEKVQVVSGALPASSGEETLDAEWSSGIASGAKIRIYATTDLFFNHLDQAYQYIINDLSNQRALHQLSMSYGLGEDYMPPGQMDTDAAYFAAIAGRGVTIFASSGDGGSNPGTDGQYSPSNPVQVESPANDPMVTAVGGTSLLLNSNGTVSSETVWFDGTGGGQSQHFPRPVWQPGTISGSGRLVPDVALDADPNTGVLVILDGSAWQFGGTSLSSPVWAAFCARLNQARANNGFPPVAVLASHIYPLLGSSDFRDITSGSNGAYHAGSGFDLCAGIGVPNVNNLIGVLGSIARGSGIAKDFDGDGKADVILEDSVNGKRGVWHLNNGVYAWATYLTSANPQYRIAAVGDFLRNGQSDLVWENTINGSHSIWVMNNGVYVYTITLPTLAGGSHVVGAGDFNGDGYADLVWENTTTGERTIWMLKNGVYLSSVALSTVDPSWHIAGVGDFLGNGQSDLVWENTVSGGRAIWILNHGVFDHEISLGTVPVIYHIAGVADFNGDGKADLIWENTATGTRAIWFLNNGVYSSARSLPSVPTTWHIVDH
jgi:subtilase family serine protease